MQEKLENDFVWRLFTNFLKLFLWILSREIILGEHTILNDPDCTTGPNGKCLAPIYKRKPAEIIVHENYDQNVTTSLNDLALIRVDKMMPLFSENSTISNVVPVCLPWKSSDPGRQLGQKLVSFYRCFLKLNNLLISLWVNYLP